MRIVIANDTYYPHKNGCSYAAQRLAFYLQKQGHEILIIAPSKTIHQGFYSHNGIRIFGIRSIPVFYKNYRFSPPLVVKRAIRKVIEKFNPGIVHIQGHFFICATALGAAKKLGIPVVGTNHFLPDNLTPFFHLPNKVDRLIHKLAWLHFRHVFHKLDFATTPTKSAGNVLKNIGFKKEVRPVTNGIDMKILNPRNNGDYLKKKYLIPNKKVLLYVGRLDREKNINWVVNALALVLKEVDIQFVVVGAGSQRNPLKDLAASLGIEKSITFTGSISDHDLPNIYRIADCFVIAGTVELQSLVAMEAMASGLPIIAANALALPELVSDGENGYLFHPGNIREIADAIIKIFGNPDLQKQMGKKSLELIKKHEISKAIEELEGIYQSLQKKAE